MLLSGYALTCLQCYQYERHARHNFLLEKVLTQERDKFKDLLKQVKIVYNFQM